MSLPAESLREALRIARNRKVDLSTVIGEALAEGLRLKAAAERGSEVIDRYKRAFSGFAEEEIAILDGVTLEPATRK